MQLVPLVIALTLASPAAPKKANTWVCLVRVQGEVPQAWREDLQKAAESAGKEWVAPPAVTLEEAQLALGCAGWNDSCAGQIASMTGAAQALVVDVSTTDAGVVLVVQQVKAGGAGVGEPERAELKGHGPEELAFAKDFVRGAVKGPREKSAMLYVDTDVPGAEVKLDGEPRGKTPWHNHLGAGEHTLLLSAEGKAPLTKKLTLKPGSVTNLSEALSAAPPPVDVTPAVGVKPEVHEVVTPPAQPPAAAAPAGAPDAGVVGWGLAGSGGVLGVVGALVTSVVSYDVCCNRDDKGNLPKQTAFGTLLPFYNGAGRGALLAQASAWIGGGIAAMGVGGLLVGTGVVVALGEPPEAAAPPAAATAPPAR